MLYDFGRSCTFFYYSWLSLSRTRLSRITAYLEVKIWSLPKHENLTTSKKYCGKEEKLLLRSNFSSFPQYFRYISNVKSPITYKFVKCGCSNYIFLNSENLICRGTDISKCFRGSLEIRDNESRLYFEWYKTTSQNRTLTVTDGTNRRGPAIETVSWNGQQS